MITGHYLALYTTSYRLSSSAHALGRQKNAAEVADFVKQLDWRLGTVVTFARQAPQQPVRLFCQDESRLGLHCPHADG
jgi:hypothetical protein